MAVCFYRGILAQGSRVASRFPIGLRHMGQMKMSQAEFVQGNSVDDKEDSIQRTLKQIRHMMTERGDSLYDKFSTQEEHGRMTAYMAMQNGASDSTVAACYLHDIGHLLLNEHAGRGDFLDSDKVHEEIGARFLKRAFPLDVTEVVRLHVDAKRYLCTVDPEYHSGLSEASQRSFELQGGCLSEAEAAAWISQPFAQQAAQLRKWEDEGKRLWRDGHVQEQDLPKRDFLMQIVERVLKGPAYVEACSE
eukprot:gnl/MRDRNA2_/MRDRNA2_94532_c0_seq1.p1 gnl/MRDRNA2_/MRDRNA2_94532_c0~~gnl/MRDRNA2_/MRDRNA2_94532_c0_seq1.p1  ORF type:complete len:248 (+),score=47.68 gnl/MRDRNA2_/MRDRNA2_94532_c0_seq1:75-818(+)